MVSVEVPGELQPDEREMLDPEVCPQRPRGSPRSSDLGPPPRRGAIRVRDRDRCRLSRRTSTRARAAMRGHRRRARSPNRTPPARTQWPTTSPGTSGARTGASISSQSPFVISRRALARLARAPYAQIEPFVFRQVLEHELAHFEFEVMGTKLEAIYGTPLYRSYLVHRFSTSTRWTGPPWARGAPRVRSRRRLQPGARCVTRVERSRSLRRATRLRRRDWPTPRHPDTTRGDARTSRLRIWRAL